MHTLLHPVPPALQQATANPHPAKDSRTLTGKSGSVSLGSLLLSPGSWCTQCSVVPSKSLFPCSVLDYVKVIMLKVVYLDSSLSTVIELCNLWTQLFSGLRVSHQFINIYLLSPHCVQGFVLGIRNREMNKTTS